jgi:hypothetical protein
MKGLVRPFYFFNQYFKFIIRIQTMASMKVLGFLAFLLILIPLASAATCAERSYAASCRKCSFDNVTGKMDPACYNAEQGAGVACLFAAYPAASIQYKLGSCPGIDTCVERVQTCKALYSNGNDQYDCEDGSINNCFVQGDICVAEAAKDCSQPPPAQPMFDVPPPGLCDGLFFFLIPLIGAVLFLKKE